MLRRPKEAILVCQDLTCSRSTEADLSSNLENFGILLFSNSAGRDRLLNGLYSMTPSYDSILLKDLGHRQPTDDSAK